MNVAYYMPFKPPEHANPSGDLITGRELRDFLIQHGHRIELASHLRSRWIYWKPLNYIQLERERKRICTELRKSPVDLWLTYHSYYKAPDMLGPACSRNLQIPYIIFQGIYSTKRRRSLKTLPGFLLNRSALQTAQLVVTNKRKDQRNLRRLLPEERVLYIAPGLQPDQFSFDPQARSELRKEWQVGDRQVILSTAMLRPGVKSEGMKQIISSCADLQRSGQNILLIVIGDGRNRSSLQDAATNKLGPNCLFLGQVARSQLYRYYSAADLFAFPGIEESLGMVYLEAQSVGLPVVAFADWGASEAVLEGKTGLLTPASQPEGFTGAIMKLLTNPEMRKTMGNQAREHIRNNHDLARNYRLLVGTLQKTIQHYHRNRSVLSG